MKGLSLENTFGAPARADEKQSPSSELVLTEEGTSRSYLIVELIVIGMAMAPIPVVLLLLASRQMKLPIVPMVFAQVDSIGTVFAVIPLMIVTMIVIVVASVIALSDHNFLGSRGLGNRRSSEHGRQKSKTQIFVCYVQGVLRKSRAPTVKSWLARSMPRDGLRVCTILDTTTCALQVRASCRGFELPRPLIAVIGAASEGIAPSMSVNGREAVASRNKLAAKNVEVARAPQAPQVALVLPRESRAGLQLLQLPH